MSSWWHNVSSKALVSICIYREKRLIARRWAMRILYCNQLKQHEDQSRRPIESRSKQEQPWWGSIPSGSTLRRETCTVSARKAGQMSVRGIFQCVWTRTPVSLATVLDFMVPIQDLDHYSRRRYGGPTLGHVLENVTCEPGIWNPQVSVGAGFGPRRCHASHVPGPSRGIKQPTSNVHNQPT